MNQAIGFFVVQGFEDQGVDDAEDAGGGRDTEGEDRDHGRREDGTSSHAAPRVSKISQEGFQGSSFA